MVFEKKNQKRRGASSHDSAVTIITPGCHFNGKLYCKGSSRIGGRIEGEVVSDGILIIEEEAVVHAKIKAEEAIVQGRIKGKLEASFKVELDSTSHFEGDLVTPSLTIKEGAVFNGYATMSDKSADGVVEDINSKKEPTKDGVPEIGISK